MSSCSYTDACECPACHQANRGERIIGELRTLLQSLAERSRCMSAVFSMAGDYPPYTYWKQSAQLALARLGRCTCVKQLPYEPGQDIDRCYRCGRDR